MANHIFRNYLADKEKVLALANSMLEAHINDTDEIIDYSKIIEEKKQELEKLTRKLDNYIEMRAEGEISKEQFTAKTADAKAAISKLKAEISEMEAITGEQTEVVPDYKEKLTVLQYALEQYTNADDNDIPESVIEAFVVKIVAKQDGYDWYLRFDGDPNDPLHLKTEGKRRKTTSVLSESAVSPTKVDSTTKSYQYTYLTDGEGRTVYEKDSMSGERTTYQYDSEGRLLGERVYNNQGYVYRNQLYGITNTFDESGNVTNEALTGNGYTHNMPFTYNEEGRQTSATLTSVRALSYAYNDDGQLETRTLTTDTPIVESYTYNDDGFIEAHRVDDATRDDTYSYTYDESGNITEIKQNGNIIFSYVYDELNQLVRENNSVSGKTVTFSYDGYGNIDSKSEYAYTLGELGTATDTVNYVYDSEWKDKLTSYDGQGITYDAIGNPTNYMGATMTWNGRQLMSYSKDGTNVSYTYDGDGLRTSKTVNGVKHNYYYVDGVLMYEKNDVYDYYYRYDQDGRLAMIIRRRLSDNYKWYYYIVSNTRGDIMEIHNGQGQITARYNYDAWGKLISITNANGTPLADGSFAHLVSVRYRGYYYDTETGLYYLQSRYYDPETGRFINADDVDYIGYSGEQLSYNAFAYCENNAVNDSDPWGYLKIKIIVQYYYKKIFNNFYIGKNIQSDRYIFLFQHFKYGYNVDWNDASIFGKSYFPAIVVVWDKRSIKLDVCFEKSVEKNAKYIKAFVEEDLCYDLALYSMECYSAIYSKKYPRRTASGIELEILLHLYMYYFGIDAEDGYASSKEIDIDNYRDGLVIERLPIKSLIKVCEKAIINNKQNKTISKALAFVYSVR